MRIVGNPAAMTHASGVLRLVSEDSATAASGIRSAPVPAMPPGMAAGYTAEIEGVAARLLQLGEPLNRTADDLAIRAGALAAAVDITDAQVHAGQRIVVALRGPAVAASGGATVTFTSKGAVVTTGSGHHIAMPDLALTDANAGDVPAGSHQAVGGAPAHAVHHAVLGGGTPAASASGGHGGASMVSGDHGHHPAGPFRATEHDAGGGLPGHHMPHDGASQKDWGCWMGAEAAHAGVPAVLPIAMALARSGLQNLPQYDGHAGLFGMGDHREFAPPGVGLHSDAQPGADWWVDNPDAQLAHVLGSAHATAAGYGLDTRDDSALTTWAQHIQPDINADHLAAALGPARSMVSHCRHGMHAPDLGAHAAGNAISAGSHAGALQVAKHELGVKEIGESNTGPQVDQYLKAADVAPGNPWCASFVAWSAEHSGHPMPGHGWAAVSTWVGAAEHHQDGLSVVPADQARPGDIVAYDWGGGTDFGGDGHIGFLDSHVTGGQFQAVEGNAGGAVQHMQRNVGEGNVVFLRASA